MKNFTTFLSSKLLRSLALLFITFNIVGLISCKKQDEIITKPTVSFFRVINASPTLGTFDVYINTILVNKAAFPFGGTTNYVQPSAGQCDLRFTIANNSQSVLSKSVNLTANMAYSYYLINKGANLDGLLVTDVMGATTTEKAYVKFINLSPDAPLLSLNIIGGANLASSKAYKASSDFIAVDPNTQSFEIIGSNVKTTLLNEPLMGGRYYTIIARGYLNPGNNDQAFSAQAIINQ